MGGSAGRQVDHPCGGQISPWPARKVTDNGNGNDNAKLAHKICFHQEFREKKEMQKCQFRDLER